MQGGAVKEPIAEFRAIIPDIQSAIKVGSDGARVQLDVPELDIAETTKLIAYGRRKVLRITVHAEEVDTPVDT